MADQPKHVSIYGSAVKYWTFNDDQPTTIVMVHGFRGTHEGLQKIIDQLPQYRIIIPDLPGFGESTPMQAHEHDIPGYTAFLSEFLKKIAPSQPILLGHSFGSIVAAHLAAMQPNLISKLILLNPIAASPLKGPRIIFAQLTRAYYWLGCTLPERSGQALLGSKGIVMITSIALAKTKDPVLRRAIHRSHLQNFSTFQNRDVIAQSFRASVTATAADRAEAITMPTLLIAGSIDDVAPAKGQYLLEKRLPNARLVMLKDIGHLIHHEAPREAAQAIDSFLQNKV